MSVQQSIRKKGGSHRAINCFIITIEQMGKLSIFLSAGEATSSRVIDRFKRLYSRYQRAQKMQTFNTITNVGLDLHLVECERKVK